MSWTGAGYTCSVCGRWVSSEAYHSCGGSLNQPKADPTWMTLQALFEIRSYLARIANALEKATEKK